MTSTCDSCELSGCFGCSNSVVTPNNSTSLGAACTSKHCTYFNCGDKWDEKLECYTRYDGACSPFQSIPMTFWWAITTMTTVGYGDAYPITEWGKVVAAGTMVIGLLSIALPTTVLGVQFSDAYAQVTSQRQTNKLKLKMRPEKMQEEIEENVAAIQQVSRELDILLPDLKVLLQKVAKTNGNAHIDPVFAIFNDGAIQSVHKLVEFVNHAAH
eukprot:GEMP01047438.1.p1 GENE.GEMP01047438.1~~GEMP01047438.1.p1  ORF type:complete len:213 (+),score=39.29 GEMP01047438.1:856-1494(+)